MNFQWMIDHIGSLRVFLILGIGLLLSTLTITLSLFRGRGWLRGERERDHRAAAPTFAPD